MSWFREFRDPGPAGPRIPGLGDPGPWDTGVPRVPDVHETQGSWSMRLRGPRYPGLWDQGGPCRVRAGRVHGSRAGHEAQPCPEPLSPHRSPLSPQRLWSPPVTRCSPATPGMERGGLGLPSERSHAALRGGEPPFIPLSPPELPFIPLSPPAGHTPLFTDTLRPGTLPSLSDLGVPVEVKKEEKKVRPGCGGGIWDGWDRGCPMAGLGGLRGGLTSPLPPQMKAARLKFDFQAESPK